MENILYTLGGVSAFELRRGTGQCELGNTSPGMAGIRDSLSSLTLVKSSRCYVFSEVFQGSEHYSTIFCDDRNICGSHLKIAADVSHYLERYNSLIYFVHCICFQILVLDIKIMRSCL